MNFPLAGYSSHQRLRASGRASVYEAEREGDGARVLVKILPHDLRFEAWVAHERELLADLEPGVEVARVGIERAGEHTALIVELPPGPTLAELVAGEALELPRFLVLARALARALAKLHERGVIHRGLSPATIVMAGEGSAPCFVDYGVGVLVEGEDYKVHELQAHLDILQYIAPESTRRTKREVDTRADLYSLGAIFYELITGRPPFRGRDAVELVYAHLSRTPRSPLERRQGLPTALADIVMKLLAKSPDDRYRSVAGLLADLDKLEAALGAAELEPRFALGQLDYRASLDTLHHLHGRAAELEALEAELGRALNGRETRLVLLDGVTGMGKTTLIRGFEGRLVARGGRIAGGRFGVGAREQPHRGLVEAFDSLADQLPAEGEERLELWRGRLRESLGPLAGVVVDLAPSLGAVIGESAAPPAVEIDEVERRLGLAIARALAAVGARGPLVLLLENLDRADADSLALVRGLVDQGQGIPMLILATLSDPAEDGEGERSTLAAAVAELDEDLVARLHLGALRDEQLRELLAETLGRDDEELGELARWLGEVTGNNPLFARLLLRRLHERGLLVHSAKGWSWELEAVAAAERPDALEALMREEIAGLSPAQRDALAWAACVGQSFELPTLLELSATPGPELARSLHQLEHLGLLAGAGAGQRFAHPRLRELGRELLDAEERRRRHAAVAQHLLAERDDSAPRCFEILDHLEASVAGLDPFEALGDAERRRFAELCARAGHRALEVAAWSRARVLLERAGELYGPELDAAWADRESRPHAFALAFAHARAEAMSGRGEGAFEALGGRGLSAAELGDVAACRARIAGSRDDLEGAVRVALEGLAELGFDLGRQRSRRVTLRWILRGWRAVHALGFPDRPARAHEDRDREAEAAACRVLEALANPAGFLDFPLYATAAGLHAYLIAGFERAAMPAWTPMAVTRLAAIAALELGWRVEAAALCDRVLELASDQPSPWRARAESLALMMVWPMTRSWRDIVERVVSCERALIEVGELETAGHLAGVGLGLFLEAGTRLPEIVDIGRGWRSRLERHGDRTLALSLGSVVVLAEVLSSLRSKPDRLIRPRAEELGFPGLAGAITYLAAVNRIVGLWLLGRREQAWVELEPVLDSFASAMLGSWQVARATLIAAVLLGDRAKRVDEDERELVEARLARLHELARVWSQASADNFGATEAMVEAEHARVLGQIERALAAYERARALASEQGFDLVEVIACERMATFDDEQGRATAAYGARVLALAAAQRWGAAAVAERIESEYGLGWVSRRSWIPGRDDRVDARADLELIVATSQLIAEELRLDVLLGHLLAAAGGSAGADRVALVIERAGAMSLVAIGNAFGAQQFLDAPVALADAGVQVPVSLIEHVLRTGEAVCLDDARIDPRFAADPYVVETGVCSLLCMPMTRANSIVGAVVLEIRARTHAFGPHATKTLELLLAQAASVLTNARLYAALQGSEAQWRSLVDGVPGIISLMDTSGRIEFVNQLEPYDVPPSALVGVDSALIMSSTEEMSWPETLREVVATGETRELEVELAPPEGEVRWYSVRVGPIVVDGRVDKLISVATDVTERKRAERERERLEAQLRQQQRLESVGTLASGVAHEINNPIQGIMNYAELIGQRPDDTETVTEFSAEITTEAQRVADIVRSLMAFSRRDREQTELEARDVSALVESTLSLIQTVLRRDQIELRVEVGEGLPRIRCRVQQIQQVIMNLVTNSRDALNERFSGRHPDKLIEIRAHAHERDGARWLRLSVEDRGGGIPEEVQGRIFDPFYTSKGRDQGTGLGLAVSHGIAVEHGGELSFSTRPGVGSTFHLDLPAMTDGA